MTLAVTALRQATRAYEACHGADSRQQDAARSAAAERSLQDACDALRRTVAMTDAGPLAEAMTGAALNTTPMLLMANQGTLRMQHDACPG